MDTIFRVIGNWLTNLSTVLIIGPILFLWLVVWTGNDLAHSGCTDVTRENIFFIKDICIDEGIRNARWINKLFPILLIIGCVVTFIKSVLSMYANEISGRN